MASKDVSYSSRWLARLRLARPKDWIKNVFVLMPVPFAVAAGHEVSWRPLVWGVVGFCLITSAVYTLNDLWDAAADRLHPTKRHRPIAAGEVSARAAWVQVVTLVVAGIGLLLATGSVLAVALAVIYLVVNLTYSGGAKHVALLDVFLLSSGFVIRVLLGCALIAVVPSAWLLLCTSALALFLGFTKRRADLVAGLDVAHRPSLRGYSREFLDQAVSICAGVAMLAYALYLIEAGIMVPGREMASMPPVAYAIFNYLRLSQISGEGGSPVEFALHSRGAQVCGLAWAVAVTWSLGLW
jgi:4-hydroxybenzoate polyprenyltransferase